MGRAFEFRKERKMKRWGKMAKVFTRIGKDIVIAVKAGGPDPDTNAKLRAVMQNAKSANMPKDNIERAIKRASDKDTSDYKEGTFEGYGPHGIAVMVETATDNNQRTVANVRSYFNKTNGSLGTTGSVAFMFDHTCYFKIAKGDINVEELEFELIDHGAEEVFLEEASGEENNGEEGNVDLIAIYGAFENFGNLQSGLESLGHEILSSGFERIPNVMKEISEEQMQEIDKLLEKLDDDDDVQTCFTIWWTRETSLQILSGYTVMVNIHNRITR